MRDPDPSGPDAAPAGGAVGPARPSHRRRTGGRPVRFGPEVVLTKEEAFGACQALADAGRMLVRSGGAAEADVLSSLFALLEERLTTG